MKYLRYYAEKFQITPDDDISLTDKKNLYNKVEGYITEFDQKKRELENIYLNFKDRLDLLTKLRAGKFIKDDQPENISFDNPLFSSWTSYLNLKRKLKDTEKTTKEISDKYDVPQGTTQPEKETPTGEIQQVVQKQKEESQTRTKEILIQMQKAEQDHKKNYEDMKKRILDIEKNIQNYKK